MEDTHGAIMEFTENTSNWSLNPYYNGRYSWSILNFSQNEKRKIVLILIIMEDTHGVDKTTALEKIKKRLNPYYNGRYSWSLRG